VAPLVATNLHLPFTSILCPSIISAVEYWNITPEKLVILNVRVRIFVHLV